METNAKIRRQPNLDAADELLFFLIKHNNVDLFSLFIDFKHVNMIATLILKSSEDYTKFNFGIKLER